LVTLDGNGARAVLNAFSDEGKGSLQIVANRTFLLCADISQKTIDKIAVIRYMYAWLAPRRFYPDKAHAQPTDHRGKWEAYEKGA
jgi:hypothetical protein